MTVYYLSGPVSNPDPAVMRANKARFSDAKLRLQAVITAGDLVISPCEVCAKFEASYPAGGDPVGLWRGCMRLCLSVLMNCDAIVLLPGYRRSKGAKEELRSASVIGLRVHLLQDLLDRMALAIHP